MKTMKFLTAVAVFGLTAGLALANDHKGEKGSIHNDLRYPKYEREHERYRECEPRYGWQKYWQSNYGCYSGYPGYPGYGIDPGYNAPPLGVNPIDPGYNAPPLGVNPIDPGYNAPAGGVNPNDPGYNAPAGGVNPGNGNGGAVRPIRRVSYELEILMNNGRLHFERIVGTYKTRAEAVAEARKWVAKGYTYKIIEKPYFSATSGFHPVIRAELTK